MAKKSDSHDKEDRRDVESRPEHKMRMRFGWTDLIEDLIQEGQENGAFDNLKGQGKPLKLKQNVFEGDQELANTLLKDNNLQPAWIVSRVHIREQITGLKNEMRRIWQRHTQAVQMTNDEVHVQALMLSWSRACKRWEMDIGKLNKEIDDYNLRRPDVALEIYKLGLDDLLLRAGAERELK